MTSHFSEPVIPVLPTRRRSMLFNGLRLLIAHPGALVWTYVANLGVALLFSLRLHAQLSSLLDHSMAAQRISSAFDLGTVNAAFSRLSYRQPPSGAYAYAGLPLYLLIYFLLVPGAFVAFRLAFPARLGTLISNGAAFFWRFIRITLLTLLVSGLILGPLFALQGAWSARIDEHVVGISALYQQLPGVLIILLVASILRLYFDLVEAYTVQLDTFIRPNGKPDRRVRKTLLPALRTLRRNLPRALGTFILLALLGLTAFLFTGRIAVLTLAQPRVWPTFLLLQAGLFLNLAARFWQRAAETILVQEHPLVFPTAFVQPAYPGDPLPDPEPPSPSLIVPDPAIYHHPVQLADDRPTHPYLVPPADVPPRT